ncbi:MAG: SurA N-terminal domain-containing protein [Desulfovibrionaceae bacterium]|nr:SurA N-terminal domain-containing protein [Desulfovibrionaceae bacterium]
MLDSIRSNAQSFGVKLAFGLIILVFVFWGVGSFTDTSSGSLVARVNGEPISARQFEQAYHNAEESLLRGNPGLTREMLNAQKSELGRQVLQSLVQQSLIRQEAARLGFAVTPLELRKAVEQIPAFQNAQGKFDAQAYVRVLEAQRMSPAQFEKEVSDQLLREKLFAVVSASAWVAPDEARIRHEFLRERRAVEYIFVPAAEFSNGITVSDADISKYYEENKTQFAVPARVDIEYIQVQPETLVKAESISEADARTWYAANKARFAVAEAVKAAHILVPLAENASPEDEKKAREAINAIQGELKAGKDFAAVADAHNGPNAAGPGGALGWVERGQTVAPFEEAAFALAPGRLSEPVRSQFGLHLIRVEDRRAASTKSFEEVQSEARAALAQEQGTERLQDVLDSLIADNIEGKPLADSAARYGLEAKQSGLHSRDELIQRLGLTQAGADSLMEAGDKMPVDTALECGDGYMIVRVSKAEPATTLSLDAARADIVKRLTAEQALKAALEKASTIRKELKDGPLPEGSIAKWRIKSVPAVERGGALPDFAPDAPLGAAIFAARPETWLPVAYAVVNSAQGQGALLCRVASILPPNDAEWDMVGEMMLRAVTAERSEGLTRLFLQDLFSKAKVEVLNAGQVDRVNM